MELYIWRHPRPLNAVGICLGQTNMGVDKRKLRRLANQIQRFARRHQLPKVIWVSPLQRSARVGELLVRRGWQCKVADELAEVDFGGWDGCHWSTVPRAEIDAWCADFADYAPGGGESVRQLFARVADWLHSLPATPQLAVGHAGWISAARLLSEGLALPVTAADWPRPVAYCTRSLLTIPAALP